MYDLLVICALRRFFQIINVCWDSFRAIIIMTAGCHDFLIRINNDISQQELFSVDYLLPNAVAMDGGKNGLTSEVIG